MPYTVNAGDGAFYGPKIDFHIEDSLKRSWQLGTIQLDFSMPQRFELVFTDKDNVEKAPVMIHRAVLGSFERFIGILIEHYAGEFPLWLAPVQAVVMAITDAQLPYAQEVQKQLLTAGIRTEIDERNEKVGYKIREWETKKVPYMLVVGEKERLGGTVAVRRHRLGDQGAVATGELIARLSQQIHEKALTS